MNDSVPDSIITEITKLPKVEPFEFLLNFDKIIVSIKHSHN